MWYELVTINYWVVYTIHFRSGLINIVLSVDYLQNDAMQKNHTISVWRLSRQQELTVQFFLKNFLSQKWSKVIACFSGWKFQGYWPWTVCYIFVVFAILSENRDCVAFFKNTVSLYRCYNAPETCFSPPAFSFATLFCIQFLPVWWNVVFFLFA